MTSRPRSAAKTDVLIRIVSLYRSLLRLITPLAVSVILLTIAVIIYQNWSYLVTFHWQVNYASASLSFLLCIATWLFYGLNWGVMTRRLGSGLTLYESMRLYFVSSVATFIPGRVWYIASRIYLYDREGVKKAVTSLALIMEVVILVLSATTVFAIATLWSPLPQYVGNWSFLLLLIIPMIVVLAYPSFLTAVVNFFLTKLGRERISLDLCYKDTLGWLVLYALNWCVGGIVLYYLLNALWTVPSSCFPVILQGVCLSSVISQVFFLIPAGLGVREVTLVYLLSPTIPMPVAIVGSLLFRIWLMLGEATCLLLLSSRRKALTTQK